MMVLEDIQAKSPRSYNYVEAYISLVSFLLSCREGHPSDDNTEVILSLIPLLQGQPSTKRAALCWIISILLILWRWYGYQTVVVYSKTGSTNCL